MKILADRNRREVELAVGDQVYLKLQPYRLRSLASRPNEKLSPCYYRPFEVEEKIGQVAYRLKLPETARIHPIFHISQLKKRIGPSVTCTPLPNCLNEAAELEAQPEEVLDFRYSQQGDLELLIKWDGLQDHENSWELYKNLIHAFPHLHLEDKVPLDERGNVRARVYVRKKKGGGKTRRKARAEEETGKQIMVAEGCNFNADGSSGGDSSKQFMGAPDGSTPESAKAADSRKSFGTCWKRKKL